MRPPPPQVCPEPCRLVSIRGGWNRGWGTSRLLKSGRGTCRLIVSGRGRSTLDKLLGLLGISNRGRATLLRLSRFGRLRDCGGGADGSFGIENWGRRTSCLAAGGASIRGLGMRKLELRSGTLKLGVRSGVGAERGTVALGPPSPRFRADGDHRADPKSGGENLGTRGISILGVTFRGVTLGDGVTSG